MVMTQFSEQQLQAAQREAYVRQSNAVPTTMTQLALWRFNATDIKPANPMIPKEKHLIDTTVRFCLERNIHNIPPVFIIDTSVPNAASVNGNDIIFTRALFNQMTPKQLDAIVGHELSHHRHNKRDFLAAGAISILSGTTVGIGWKMGLDALQEMKYIKPQTAQLLGNHNVSLLPMWFAISASMVPYRFFQEYEADKEGAQLASPEVMKDALNALEKQVDVYKERHNDTQPNWRNALMLKILNPFASHPKTPDRIIALDKMEKNAGHYAGRIHDETNLLESGRGSLA